MGKDRLSCCSFVLFICHAFGSTSRLREPPIPSTPPARLVIVAQSRRLCEIDDAYYHSDNCQLRYTGNGGSMATRCRVPRMNMKCRACESQFRSQLMWAEHHRSSLLLGGGRLPLPLQIEPVSMSFRGGTVSSPPPHAVRLSLSSAKRRGQISEATHRDALFWPPLPDFRRRELQS